MEGAWIPEGLHGAEQLLLIPPPLPAQCGLWLEQEADFCCIKPLRFGSFCESTEPTQHRNLPTSLLGPVSCPWTSSFAVMYLEDKVKEQAEVAQTRSWRRKGAPACWLPVWLCHYRVPGCAGSSPDRCDCGWHSTCCSLQKCWLWKKKAAPWRLGPPLPAGVLCPQSSGHWRPWLGTGPAHPGTSSCCQVMPEWSRFFFVVVKKVQVQGQTDVGFKFALIFD